MRRFLVTYVQAYANFSGVWVSKPNSVYLVVGDMEQVPYFDKNETMSSVTSKLTSQGFRRSVKDSNGKQPWVMPAAILSVEEVWGKC